MLILFLFLNSAQASPCTYETWDWDAVSKTSVNHQKVVTTKESLTRDERGETPGCSVCIEDQLEIKIPGAPRFTVCKTFAERVKRAVQGALNGHFPITTIVGYRVGKSKGPLDSAGRRTQFSNHSYGTAIDFNSEINGLYDFCVEFSPQCKLIRGGEYHRGARGSITHESILYQLMIAEKFKWGGDIRGKQKDFMHFSVTGM